MSRFVLAASIILAGCAASQPAPRDSPAPKDLVAQHQVGTLTAGSTERTAVDRNALSTSMEYFLEPVAFGGIVDAEPTEVWPLLLRAYEAVGIRPDFVDSSTLTVADSHFDITQWLAGLQASPFINCGSGVGELPLAERAQWYGTSSVASRLLPLGEGATSVVTRFEAIALPSRAFLGEAPECRSTGHLEGLIVDRISAGLEQQAAPAGIHEEPSSSLAILVNQNVRVTVPPATLLTGILVSVRSGMLVIRAPQLTSVPLSSVTRVEVRRSRPSRGKIGALLGVAVGALAGWSSAANAEDEHWRSQGRTLGPGIGAIAGGLLGAFIGSRFGGDYWEEVSMDGVGSG